MALLHFLLLTSCVRGFFNETIVRSFLSESSQHWTLVLRNTFNKQQNFGENLSSSEILWKTFWPTASAEQLQAAVEMGEQFLRKAFRLRFHQKGRPFEVLVFHYYSVLHPKVFPQLPYFCHICSQNGWKMPKFRPFRVPGLKQKYVSSGGGSHSSLGGEVFQSRKKVLESKPWKATVGLSGCWSLILIQFSGCVQHFKIWIWSWDTNQTSNPFIHKSGVSHTACSALCLLRDVWPGRWPTVSYRNQL